MISSGLHRKIQHKIERDLAGPIERKFGKLADDPVENTIELASKYIDPSFEGEAILSVGKIVERHNNKNKSFTLYKYPSILFRTHIFLSCAILLFNYYFRV